MIPVIPVIPQIWLADAARAFAALSPGSQDRERQILTLLGLLPTDRPRPAADPSSPSQAPPAPALVLPVAADVPPRTEETPPPDDVPTRRTPPPFAPVGPPRTGREPVDPMVAYVPPRSDPLEDVTLPRPETTPTVDGPAIDPLLTPATARAVLQALLDQPGPDGPVDTDALVTAVATCTLARSLPRRPMRTLRFGVQVLADQGDSMTPFRADQDQIVQQIRELVGEDGLEEVRFTGAPGRGADHGPDWSFPWDWDDYRPPSPRTRILVLSHLAAVGRRVEPEPARRREWVEFAETARVHGCSVVVLAPLPTQRLAEWVAELFPVVTWDRSLTVGDARRVIR